MWDPYAEFESAVLPNGLSVYAAHWPNRPWQAMGFLIHSGAMHDHVGLEGTAHFVEHMVSRNVSMPRIKINQHFENRGGSAGFGETSYFGTEFKFFVPIDGSLESDFSIFGQMLMSARLEKELENQRFVIAEEFKEKFGFKPIHDVLMRERRMVFAGEFISNSISSLGSLDSIGAITQEDLQLFYDKHYVPANMSIVGVGGLALSDILAILEKSPFSADKAGRRSLISEPSYASPYPAENRYVNELSRFMERDSLPKTGAYRSVAKIPGSVNNQTVRIVRDMLGNLLYEELRERLSWTYGIGTSFANFGGFYAFYIGCDSFNLDVIDKIEGVIENLISLAYDNVELFSRMKEKALAKVLLNDLSGKKVRNGAMNDLSLFRRILTAEEFSRWIEDVTIDDVNECLRWLRPERRWTCISCP